MTSRLLRMAWALLHCSAAVASPAARDAVQGPYKHAPLGFDRETHRMMTAVGGPTQPLALTPSPRPQTVVTWAFALGDCGSERWGEGIDTDRFAAENVKAFVEAGVGYIVSSGGQGGQFDCDSDEGMERFIARYASAQLKGLDFDIEAGQSDAAIDALVATAKAAQERHPALSMSFTLPTFASSDGSGRSLNALGLRVLSALRRHRFDAARINLMAMDYGDAVPAHCVVRRTADGPRCDMGRSAMQAALNLHRQERIPLSRIELTVMPGVNDVVHNVFTLDDARWLAAQARRQGLGGLHAWSLDRDRPCPVPQAGASAECSGLAAPPLSFVKVLFGSERKIANSPLKN